MTDAGSPQPTPEPLSPGALRRGHGDDRRSRDALMTGCMFGCLGSFLAALAVSAALFFFMWWTCAR